VGLSDRVQDRVSAQRLIHLTNPDVAGASTLDAGRLAAAVEDAEAEFEVRVGVAYDDTDARHVAAAVPGVVALLNERAGTKGAGEMVERWNSALDRLRRVTGSDRITPRTNSVLIPTPEDEGRSTPARPDFDRRRFRGFTLDAPHSPDAGVDDEG